MTTTNAINIDHFLPYMRDVIRCEQSLHELNLMWRMIESSAKMNCPVEAKSILPTMAKTRASFSRLEDELVFSLVQEKVSTIIDEIGTKSQYVIDILVRNLYERTADVGFLATDNELCAFVAEVSGNEITVGQRLRAYRSKYTVYDEIILLDLQGNVLVQINEESPIEGSLDPLIATTLATDNYVETFRYSDLRPKKTKTLIYSKRMLHPNTGSPIGILCLCFNFTEEMSSIFKSHGDSSGRSVMLLLDDNHHVIDSSDHLWIPVGSTVPVNLDAKPKLMMFAGREYLVSTFSAAAYQGYLGPRGWKGQVMIPVEVAFYDHNTKALKSLDPQMADGLLSHAKTFCPPLFEIITAAETIRRVVWNGQLMTTGFDGELLKLKTILDQISETGTLSNELFSASIDDLYETVLNSKLQDTEFISHLLVDLLDRNLYERSNDCRWWALTPELRAALAKPSLDRSTAEHITEILDYINKLYTVYTRIFVYDMHGSIIASTNPIEATGSILGTKIDAITLSQVLSLRNDQQYHVTPFAPNPLYANAPTYVYHAPIMAPETRRAVGGIGIVFDATKEFSAMLQGGIVDKASMSAFYVNRQGKIIASTDPTRPVGNQLDMDAKLLSLPNGKSGSSIVTHDGHYAIMGYTASHGYREFKVADGYQEDVIAVIFDVLGEVRHQPTSTNHATSVIDHTNQNATHQEFATFFINGGLFAVETEHVIEAIAASEISTLSMGSRTERVGVLSVQYENEAPAYLWVFDLGYLLSGIPSTKDNSSQVVIVKHQQHKVGLLVSALHTVARFNDAQIGKLSSDGRGGLIKQIIKANEGRLLIQSVDIEYLLKMLSNPFEEISDMPA